MPESSNNTANSTERHNIFHWLLFPLALFPLAALLSYDWRSIPELRSPAAEQVNWIGNLGDGFAYYGYQLLGIAVWLVPLLIIVSGILLIRGRRMKPGRKMLWLLPMLLSCAGIMQVAGAHANAFSALARQLNIGNAGGAFGYLMMTKLLSPLLSDFGSVILMSVIFLISIVALVGSEAIASAARSLLAWALQKPPKTDSPEAAAAEKPGAATPAAEKSIDDQTLAEYMALMAAKEDALKQRKQDVQAAPPKPERPRVRLAPPAPAEPEPVKTQQAQVAPPPPRPVAPPVQKPAVRSVAKPAPAKDTEKSDKTDVSDAGPYQLPPVSLLSPLKKSDADHGDVDEMSNKLIATLQLFGVDATMSFTVQGPVVTKYALRLAPGIRYSAVTNIQDNLMGALHAKSLRIEAPIPGKEEIGIEVPNRSPAGISFREVFESETWRNFKGELPLLFGKDAAGNELVADLASMPHMLVAGATGQGKSVCLNSLINGLLMTRTPEQLKLIMVDPKSVEFANYVSIPHLIVPIITENKKVVFSLQWAVVEMDKRLKLFARARCKNIYDFNHRQKVTQTDMFGNDTELGGDMPKTVPYIVIIIDEVADLMSQCAKEVSPHIARLTAKARAAGIHLILATQRPDAKIITGAIKANIPGRVAFKTASAVDSRTILDDSGAESLIGRGDMLFKGKDGLLVRAQGAWISDPEIINITHYIEEHSKVQFDDRFTKKLSTIKEEEIDLYADPEAEAAEQRGEAQAAREQVKADAAASDFKKAIQCIINTNRASTSHFQRQMGWGYNHAAKILDMLADKGVVSPQQGMGARQIIMDQEQLLAIFNGNDAAGGEGEAPAADAGVDAETDDAAAGDNTAGGDTAGEGTLSNEQSTEIQ